MGAIDDATERYAARQQGIDVDQWLEKIPATKETPNPVQPIETYIKARQKHPADTHPLDLLHRLDILTTRHIGAGWFLIRLRAGDLMRLDVARMGEVLKDKSRGSEGAIGNDGEVLDGDWIFILEHLLGAWQKKYVERICWQYLHQKLTDIWVHENRTAIAESFDALVIAIDKIYPPKKKMLDT